MTHDFYSYFKKYLKLCKNDLAILNFPKNYPTRKSLKLKPNCKFENRPLL